MRIHNDNLKTLTSQHEIQDLDKKIESLTPSEKLVANYYFGTSNIRKSIFVSQTLVAKKLDLSRETVNRALKKLHKLGFINKVDRGWKEDRTRIKKTCYYIINKLFFYQEIRNRYKHIFLALSYLVIFCNFESIFGIWSKDERLQYSEVVTGIKSYPNSLFINKQQHISNINISNDIVIVRDKKQTFKRGNMSIEVNKIDGSFNQSALQYLEAYPSAAIKHAIRTINSRSGINSPWRYFIKILNDWCKDHNVEPNQEKLEAVRGEPRISLPIKLPSELQSSLAAAAALKKHGNTKYVPAANAKREAAIIKPKIENAQPLLVSAVEFAKIIQEGFEKFGHLDLYHESLGLLLKQEYRLTGEPNENIAVEYINKKKAINLSRIERSKLPVKSITSSKFHIGVTASKIMKDIEEVKPKEVNFDKLITLLERSQPTQHNTANNKSTVDFVPDTSEFEPESITPNEVDYDEVLD